MADPNGISLENIGSIQDRKNTYKILHLSNIIRSNILLIAPDVDPAKFRSFLRGPTGDTANAIIVATRSLPKTIAKSVVSNLGKFQVEGKYNVGFSKTLDKLFAANFDKKAAASDFFSKNLTTAQCHGRLVMLIHPYLACRYDLKSREIWFHRLRFVWNNCALLRLPCLLPVIATQFFLYTIRMFINQPSLKRSEELTILSQLLHFLPGALKVAQPTNGVGLSVWYRSMARHRRIVLEELLNEARTGGDLRLFNPPFSMMEFESIDDVIDYIEEEIKVCDKQETMEEETGKRRRRTEKESFGEDSDIDEEDRELLLMGGLLVDREEEEEVFVEEEMEVAVEGNDEAMEEVEELEEEYNERANKSIQNGKRKMEREISPSGKRRAESGHSIVGFSLPYFGPYKHLVKMLPDYPSETCEDGTNRNDEKESGEISSPNIHRISNGEMEADAVTNELQMMREEESGQEEEKNEAAIKDLFKTIPVIDGWREGDETEWNPSHILSTQDIAQGFEEAQNLLMGDSKTMGSSMNLSIPLTPRRRKADDYSMSSDDLSSHTESLDREDADRGDNSPPIRSDDDSRDKENGREIREGEKETPSSNFGDCSSRPAPIQYAPRKEMRDEDLIEDEDVEDDVDWVETVKKEDDEIEFIEEVVGKNGVSGPRVVKREDIIKDEEMEQRVIILG